MLKSRPYSLSKSSDELEDKGLLVDDTGWFLKKKLRKINIFFRDARNQTEAELNNLHRALFFQNY